jgi:hypothetical protein
MFTVEIRCVRAGEGNDFSIGTGEIDLSDIAVLIEAGLDFSLVPK